VRNGIPDLVSRAAEPDFRPDRLAQIAAMEKWHFWFAGRRALIEELAGTYVARPTVVLDLGCGTGSLLRVLGRLGHRAIGIDALPEALEAARRHAPDAWMARAEADRLPLADGAVGAVTALDVLEHVDDGRALSEIRRVLRPGGVLIASVPAMPWLWSYRDEDAGHRRRYTRRGLERTVAEAGFDMAHLRYYQSLLFPFVVGSRLLGRRGPAARDLEERPPRSLNRVRHAITVAELALGRVVRLPWGSSLVVVARRRAGR